jgi:hypothetical protein
VSFQYAHCDRECDVCPALCTCPQPAAKEFLEQAQAEEQATDGDETQARLRGLDSELADVKAQLADLTARFNRVIAGIVKGAEGVE